MCTCVTVYIISSSITRYVISFPNQPFSTSACTLTEGLQLRQVAKGSGQRAPDVGRAQVDGGHVAALRGAGAADAQPVRHAAGVAAGGPAGQEAVGVIDGRCTQGRHAGQAPGRVCSSEVFSRDTSSAYSAEWCTRPLKGPSFPGSCAGAVWTIHGRCAQQERKQASEATRAASCTRAET